MEIREGKVTAARHSVADLEGRSQTRSALDALMGRVRIRLVVVRFACRWRRAFVVCAGVYALGLLASRLLGLAAGVFTPLSLASVPLVAALAALCFGRRVTGAACARAMDACEGTQDLFLTAALLGPNAPGFSDLVQSGAVARGATVRPRRVVPWGGARAALYLAGALVVLLAAVLWLPQLDPFGREKERVQRQARREALAASRRATEIRKARVKRENPVRERSEETELRIEELTRTFASMKPGEPKQNRAALTEQQQALGKSWQRAKQSAAALGSLPALDQAFGAESPRAEQWRKQLSQGDTQGLKQEMRELGALARQLNALPESAERRAAERELMRRLQELSRFANDKMASRTLSAALNRALAQARMGGASELSEEALKALTESLELADLELSQLQQGLNDLKSLEEALQALQLAQRCNQQGALDGAACTNGSAMADYAALYQQILAQQQACGSCAGCLAGTGCEAGGGPGSGGQGPGMGGPGQGRGGNAPEDPSLATAHVSEMSRSAMRAGKVLMQWQTDESADKGRAAVEYDQRIRELREGVSEAVVNEQIPPAYHDAIRRYFDALSAESRPAAPPPGAADGGDPE